MRVKRTLFGMSDVAWFDHPDGTHVPLPLKPEAFDAAGVEAAERARLEAAYRVLGWTTVMPSYHEEMVRQGLGAMRAALAAYARTVGGGA